MIIGTSCNDDESNQEIPTSIQQITTKQIIGETRKLPFTTKKQKKFIM